MKELTIDEIIKKLQHFQKEGFGDCRIEFDSWDNKIQSKWIPMTRFELVDIGHSDRVIIFEVNEE